MNGTEVLRIVDAIHRDKNIEKEIVFEGIEQAIVSAAKKHFGESAEIEVDIDRESGQPSVLCDGEPLKPDEIGDLLGRIAAQTAKQVMIQKIREAERDALYEEFSAQQGHIVTGAVSQVSGGTVTVNLGKIEGILPRGEQIPGESHRVGERLRAVVMDVRKAGSRVKIILSRTHPEFVRRLFELEIPEVSEHVIEVRSLSREAGYRSKVAVSCFDSKIDAVGACVGVRGARIKSIVDELAGERIDIVRWNDSLQVLVPNALQPAEVEDVILCPMLGKVIVLVRDDQLSLAIGKKGQNVRLASKLVGWDIHVLTQEKLDELLENAVTAFSAIPDVSDELAEALVEQGFFTFDDLSVIEPDQLAELGGLTAEQCDRIVAYADEQAARIEEEEKRAAQQAAAGWAASGVPGTEPAAEAGPETAETAPEAEPETAETAGAAESATESETGEAEARAESTQAEESQAEEDEQRETISTGDQGEEGPSPESASPEEGSTEGAGRAPGADPGESADSEGGRSEEPVQGDEVAGEDGAVARESLSRAQAKASATDE